MSGNENAVTRDVGRRLPLQICGAMFLVLFVGACEFDGPRFAVGERPNFISNFIEMNFPAGDWEGRLEEEVKSMYPIDTSVDRIKEKMRNENIPFIEIDGSNVIGIVRFDVYDHKIAQNNLDNSGQFFIIILVDAEKGHIRRVRVRSIAQDFSLGR